ncbi:hypothetical protein [Luteimonas sp. TWI1437]|uniref:hypothetical protein n=1 Tax=unclassified Luteimonas TaxID=2629088 RepID=UPI00320B8FA3
MNRKTIETALIRAKGKAAHLRNRVGGGMLVAMASVPAFAQNTADIEAIKADIDAWKPVVVGLVIAFAVVLWAIRAASLAKPR